MTSLRVLHVSQPTEAGVANVVLTYVGAQVESGMVVAVACPDEGPLARDVQEVGAEHLTWSAKRTPGTSVIGEILALRRLIVQWRPDVVHLHSAKAGLVGRLAVRGRIPTVFQPHAWSFSAVIGPMEWASTRWERCGQRVTHVTVCVSHAELALGRQHDVLTTAHIVPNIVDPASWPERDQSAARTELDVSLDAPVAVCVGRVCRQKGQDHLIDVWDNVRAALPGALLFIVGDGPDRADLMTRSGPGVSWVGSADPRLWYASADVVVVPSRWEGMAMVPLEAQASGRLVVANDVDGMSEGLAPSNVVVRMDEASALPSALVSALSDRGAATDLGLRSRQHAQEQWYATDQRACVSAAYTAARERCPNSSQRL